MAEQRFSTQPITQNIEKPIEQSPVIRDIIMTLLISRATKKTLIKIYQIVDNDGFEMLSASAIYDNMTKKQWKLLLLSKIQS